MANLQLDGNKLLHHLDRVNSWERGELISPIYIAFSPTSFCNHRCVFCVYHDKGFKPIFFPFLRYQNLVKEWREMGVRSVFLAGDGDPLLNKNCAEMVEVTKEAGIDVSLNTNGRLLSEKNITKFTKNLSFIRISFNAGTRETYAKVHGTQATDFDIVLKNLENLVREKERNGSELTIGVQCVLLSDNYKEIKDLASLVKKIGVDYFSVKPFLKHPEAKFNDVIPNIDVVLEDLLAFARIVSDQDFNFVLRKTLFLDKFERKYQKCFSTDFMIEIDALGDVYSCGPHIGNLEHKLGSVLHTSFQDIWRSSEAEEVRSHIRCNVDVGKCMPFCRPDSVNEFLWKIKNPPQHVNYI